MTGVVALGDSITRGSGHPMPGVPAASWARWIAEALGLPYLCLAVDGAGAAEVCAAQVPRLPPACRLGCLYVGVNDARSPDFDAQAFERALERAVQALVARAERTLLLTVPRRLGRPEAGARKTAAVSAAIVRVGARHGATVADLGDLAGWRYVLPDRVHLTAQGQLELARRALVALGAGELSPRAAREGPGRLADARFRLSVLPALALRDAMRRRRERLR